MGLLPITILTWETMEEPALVRMGKSTQSVTFLILIAPSWLASVALLAQHATRKAVGGQGSRWCAMRLALGLRIQPIITAYSAVTIHFATHSKTATTAATRARSAQASIRLCVRVSVREQATTAASKLKTIATKLVLEKSLPANEIFEALIHFTFRMPS